MDKLYDMWWDYCDQSPWKGMKPLEGQPDLGVPERFFRNLFKVLPCQLAATLYVLARHWSGNVAWVYLRIGDMIAGRQV
ncbi:hypothetical protein [Butyrivibrio fibrisolvens]|uniref:hypothetical protein n=1 Tax=Butyrivibrio fibrisolvens TaxID=831 RepID=UPI0020BEFF43|nr:hypothetical protein [Butyrivibrio fibrisolvens]